MPSFVRNIISPDIDKHQAAYWLNCSTEEASAEAHWDIQQYKPLHEDAISGLQFWI